MLIEFGVRNFRSIRDELRLTLQASTDKSLLDNVIQKAGAKEKVTGVMCLEVLQYSDPTARGKAH